MSWEALIIDAHRIDLCPGDFERARRVALDKQALNDEPRRQRDLKFNGYWGSVDVSTHGELAQAAFAYFLGISYEFRMAARGRNHAADVGDYEVKSSCWKSLETQVNWHGGRCPTGAIHAAQSPVVVYLAQYSATRETAAWLMGWIPTREARKWPRGVPVDELRTWRTLPCKVGA